jgi:hypothetical protein
MQDENQKVKTKSKKVNKAWLHDHVNDPYVKLAQKEGYRARAAYKLKEIDEQLGLIKPGPPWWWTWARARCLEPVPAPPPVAQVRGAGRGGRAQWHHHRAGHPADGADRGRAPFCRAISRGRCWRNWKPLGGRQADVVVSDMAPNLSGIESAMRRASRIWWSWRWSSPGPPQARRGAGGEAVSRQRLQPAGASCSRRRSRGQADQAQGLARQIVRDLSGGHRSEARWPLN